jgi:hypothetical protein
MSPCFHSFHAHCIAAWWHSYEPPLSKASGEQQLGEPLVETADAAAMAARAAAAEARVLVEKREACEISLTSALLRMEVLQSLQDPPASAAALRSASESLVSIQQEVVQLRSRADKGSGRADSLAARAEQLAAEEAARREAMPLPCPACREPIAVEALVATGVAPAPPPPAGDGIITAPRPVLPHPVRREEAGLPDGTAAGLEHSPPVLAPRPPTACRLGEGQSGSDAPSLGLSAPSPAPSALLSGEGRALISGEGGTAGAAPTLAHIPLPPAPTPVACSSGEGRTGEGRACGDTPVMSAVRGAGRGGGRTAGGARGRGRGRPGGTGRAEGGAPSMELGAGAGGGGAGDASGTGCGVGGGKGALRDGWQGRGSRRSEGLQPTRDAACASGNPVQHRPGVGAVAAACSEPRTRPRPNGRLLPSDGGTDNQARGRGSRHGRGSGHGRGRGSEGVSQGQE